MRAVKLGYAVLKVRNLETSAAFYRDVPGLNEIARYGAHMALFSCGEHHHDLALLEIGAGAAAPDGRQAGLYPLTFKVGDTLDELCDFRDQLLEAGVAITAQADHRVSQSLYCHDPDGILIECCVDADPAVWLDHPETVAHVGALER